jgi:YD repeat-containing protein
VRTYYQDRKVAVVDALNRQTIQEMDGLGRVIQVRHYSGNYSQGPGWNDPFYSRTVYEYDLADRLMQVTGPDHAVTTVAYDLAGRKTSMSDPNMGAWQYRYDAAGNLTKQRDARNQAICFYYDALNRLVGKTYHSGISNLDTLTCPGAPYAVSYTYDQGTNLHSVLHDVLNTHARSWGPFFKKRTDPQEWSLGLLPTLKAGQRELEVRGPSVSRAYKMVDYAIWLPEDVASDFDRYVNVILAGIEQVLLRYQVSPEEIAQIKRECRERLGLAAPGG